MDAGPYKDLRRFVPNVIFIVFLMHVLSGKGRDGEGKGKFKTKVI